MKDTQTCDRFLNGTLAVRQPSAGFRSGLDAVMLAASVPAAKSDAVLELGSGAGAAALCLAARVRDCSIRGVEIDPDLVALARSNAAENGFGTRIEFHEGDVLAPPKALLTEFDHVFCNPPFHGEEGRASPDAARAAALHDSGRLAGWLEAGLRRTASGGTFTAILRADRLGEVLAALPDRGTAILPLWPKAGTAAKRVIVQVKKGARSPLAILPGLVLHEDDGSYTADADAILRGSAGLPLARQAVV